MYQPQDFRKALDSILQYWMNHTVDESRGGFYGRIDEHDQVMEGAPKGAVLNARILWAFSAAYRAELAAHRADPATAARQTGAAGEYLSIATRAYRYIIDHFIDHRYGGVYWTLTASGDPLDTKKQIYALAFTLYGVSEYYAATGLGEVLDYAIRLFKDIEANSFDKEKGGYLEAFSRDWGNLPEVRLSAKDANEQKTMNTHLHILEAYTNLYRVWKDPFLLQQLYGLITDFLDHMIDPVTHHLVLFLDEDWNPKSEMVSFGHDIEASWLLVEAARVLEDATLTDVMERISMELVEAACQGWAPDGGLYYEWDPATDIFYKEKHWWVQAEALVGLVNAYEISGNALYMERFERLWTFTDQHIIDHINGEWIWGVKEDNDAMEHQDKAGIWKCPYHNGRAMMELIRRL